MTDHVPKAAVAVAVVGSLHYDLLLTGADRPRLGETLFGEAWAWKCGGKGGNQAIEAARHGAATAFVGAVGDDDFGKALLARLGEAGVDTTDVHCLANCGSGMSVALFDASGDYGAVIVPGSNWGITTAMLEGSRVLEDCAVLLLQNEVRPETNLAAATIAAKGNAKIVLNAAPARAVSDELLALVDLLVVNEIEAEMLAESPPISGFEAAEAAAATLLGRAPQVIVTLGGDGLIAARREGAPVRVPGHCVAVQSTHGAGDALIGAVAARLAEGVPLTDAARYANAAAAALVATPEHARGALTREATQAVLERPASDRTLTRCSTTLK